MTNKDTHILITGYRNGLGVALTAQLLRLGYHNSVLLSNPYSPVDKKVADQHGVQYITGEVADMAFLQSIIQPQSIIYHIDIWFSLDHRDIHLIEEHNIIGTEHLINLAIEHQVQKINYVGSAVSQLPHQDSHHFFTQSIKEADLHVQRGHEEGLTVNTWRPGFITSTDNEKQQFPYAGTGRLPSIDMPMLVRDLVCGRHSDMSQLSWNDANPKAILTNLDQRTYPSSSWWQNTISIFNKRKRTKQIDTLLGLSLSE